MAIYSKELEQQIAALDKPASSEDGVSAFIQQVGPTATRVASRLGVDPSALIGQWGLETGWGRSVIPGTNNYGNIKDFSGNGTSARDNMTGSVDRYRKFADADEFGNHYASLIERRYGDALNSPDAESFGNALKRGGYAEDPAYAGKLAAAANEVRKRIGFQPSEARSTAPWDNGQPFYQDAGLGQPEQAAPADDDSLLVKGIKKGFDQSVGLAGGMAAAVGDALDVGWLRDEGMKLYAEQMEKAAGLSVAPAFTDIQNADDAFKWLEENAGYAAYQAIESIATGGVGAFLLKGSLKPIAAGMAKQFVAKETQAQIAKGVAANVALKIAQTRAAQIAGAAVATTANNFRQELGSIYGEAAQNNTVDFDKILPAAIGATFVDTAADLYLGAKVLGIGKGRTGSYLTRFGKEAPAQMGVQGSTEATQSAIEQWGAGNDTISGKQMVDEGAVGALMGLGGSPVSAMQQRKPNSPLTRAVAAAVAPPSVPPAAPRVQPTLPQEQQTLAEQEAGTQAAADPAEAWAQQQQILAAQNAQAVAAQRAAMSRDATAYDGADDEIAQSTGFDEQDRILELNRLVAEEQADIAERRGDIAGAQQIRAAEAAHRQAVQAARLRNKVGAPAGSLGNLAEFENLMGEERADVESRRQRIAETPRLKSEAELQAADARVEAQRQREREVARGSVLDAVLADPSVKNHADRFAAELNRQGFLNSSPTPDELARIEQFTGVREAFTQPEIEPSTPNEMPADLVKEKRGPLSATGKRDFSHIDRALAGGYTLKGRTLVNGRGKKLNLSAAEFQYARNARRKAQGSTNENVTAASVPTERTGGPQVPAADADSVPAQPVAQTAPAIEPDQLPARAGTGVDNESDQDRSQREWGENYSKVTGDVQNASTKDLDRAMGYASHVISNLQKHAQRGEPYSADLLDAMERERDFLKTEWMKRTDRFGGYTPPESTATAAPDTAAPATAIVAEKGYVSLGSGKINVPFRGGVRSSIDVELIQLAAIGNAFTFAVHRAADDGKTLDTFNVSEASTGLAVMTNQDDAESAIAAANSRLSAMPFDRIAEAVAKHPVLNPQYAPKGERPSIGQYKGIEIGKPAAELTDEEVATIAAPDPVGIDKRNLELSKYQRDPRFHVPANNSGAVQTDFRAIRDYLRDGTLSAYGKRIDAIGARLRELNAEFKQDASYRTAASIAYAIDTGRYNDILHPDNKTSRKLFSELTGVKLPAGVAATKALFKGEPILSGQAQPEAPRTEADIKALARVEAAGKQAATSPDNDLPEPTEAQKEANNYQKGHVSLNGLDIAIENPKGSERKGVSKDGEAWSVTMPAAYGYFKGTEGADGDHVDVFIGEHPASGRVWIINQRQPLDAAPNDPDAVFDEHKVMLGYPSADAAIADYLLSFSDNFGGKVLQSISPSMSIDELKAKLPSLKKARPVKADAEATGKQALQVADQAPVNKAEPATAPVSDARLPDSAVIAEVPEPKNWRKSYGTASKYAEALGIELRENGKFKKLPQLTAEIEAKRAPAEPEPALEVVTVTTPEAAPAAIEPTTPTGYAKIMADPALQLEYQDMLDAFFQERLIAVRNALREIGWDGDRNGELSKDGKRATFGFTQVGAGRNVVGMTVNGTTDDLTKTPEALADAVDSAAKPTEPTAIEPDDDGLDALFDQVLAETAPVDLKGFEKSDAAEDGFFTLRDGDLLVEVTPTAEGRYQAVLPGTSMRSSPHLDGVQGAVEWAAAYREEAKRVAKLAPAQSPRIAKIEIVPIDGSTDLLVREMTERGYQNLARFALSPSGKAVSFNHFFESPQTQGPVEQAVKNWIATRAKQEPAAPTKKPVTPQVQAPAGSTPLGVPDAFSDNVAGIGKALADKAKREFPPRTVGQTAASAAKNTGAGLADVAKGLNALFKPKPGQINMGLGFDEDTYAQAKPLFLSGIAHFREAAADIGEMMRALINAMRTQFGMDTATIEAMKPYVLRFVRDVRDGKIDYDENVTQENENDLPADGTPATDDRAGDGGAGPADVPAPENQRGTGGGSESTGGSGDADLPGQRSGDERVGGAGTDQGADGRPGAGRPAVHDDARKPAGRDGAGAGDGVSRRDYRAPAGSLSREGSWLDTAKRNLEIIRLVKRLDADGQFATPEQQALIAKYTGFGASEIANGLFPVNYIYGKRGQRIATNEVNEYAIKPAWKEVYDGLKESLSDAELDTIKASTQYAHYTSEPIIRGMWRAAERMGFAGGKVLEPGMGSGLFMVAAPEGVADHSRYVGIEMDHLTAAIAKQLLQRQSVINASYIDHKLPKGFFDLGIGNPPFASWKVVADPEYRKQQFPLHDYFFAKTLDRVRPGGLLMFVTSRYTMDKQDDAARAYMAERADLVGAIRLPKTAFFGNAGTEVVTDVLFLKRREVGEQPGGEAWGKLAEVQTPEGPTQINEYFASHPEMVLGRHAMQGSMYRSNEYTVLPNEGEIGAQFSQAVEQLPQGVYGEVEPSRSPAHDQTTANRRDFDVKQHKEGILYIADDGEVMQVRDGAGVPLDSVMKLSDKERAWLKDYVPLRNAIKTAQLDQLNDGDWKASQKSLRDLYKAFVKKHGRILEHTIYTREVEQADGETKITRYKRFKWNRVLGSTVDVDAPLAWSLEKLDDNSNRIEDGDILTQRVLDKPAAGEIRGASDALAVSLNELGRFDLADLAARAGMTQEAAISELGDLVYEDPAEGWQLADEYLSGDVVQKLQEAQAAAATDERFSRNIEALSKVQPLPLGADKVPARLGANWIGPEVVSRFAEEVLDEGMDIGYDVRTNLWHVPGSRARSDRSAAATWGTADRSAAELLSAILNNQTITVRRTTEDKKTYVDKDATAAANDMARKIKNEFAKWVWTDAQRAHALLAVYNRKFNNLAPRHFDGRHMKLPGLSLRYKLFDHQLRAVWRVVQAGNSYLAHAVGAGKTLEMIVSAMEQKRLGFIKKPMFVVPNHMLEQFSNEFMSAYPAARILVADEENFTGDQRRRFVAKAALNDWDAVIIKQSSFKMLPTQKESRVAVAADILDELQAALGDLEKDDRVTRKKLEAQIEKIQQRVEAAGGGKKDQNLFFEELGVDFLYVDEAHTYRKLDYSTNRQVKGIDPVGSLAAFDLFVKLRWLEQQRPGRSGVLASGTPITNTLAEIYTVQRFLDYDGLREDGLHAFDAWANNFGEVATEWERNAAGGYEQIERFSKFVAIPELMSRVRKFMDVLTMDQLGNLVDRPDLVGGKPAMVTVKPSDHLKQYMEQDLLPRLVVSKAWKPSQAQPYNPDPVINIATDGRLAALDMRFVVPGAKSDPESKLNKMIDEIIRVHGETADNTYTTNDKPDKVKGGAQIVFSTLGFGDMVAQTRGFDAKGWVVKRLKEGGIPASQVAFMGDYKSDAQKEGMFREMRDGTKRVLIGSPANMGTGLNVQKRLTHLHFLTPPWYPADVEQPHGRILRQGNQNEAVNISWYVTEGTYDSTMWGMVRRKGQAIEQAMTGDASVRSVEDISEVSQYAMAEAIASGDDRVIKLAGLRGDVERLERLQQAHAREQSELVWMQSSAESALKWLRQHLKQAQAADALVGVDAKWNPVRVEGDGFASDRPGEYGKSLIDATVAILDSHAEGGKLSKRVPLATVNGKFPLTLTLRRTKAGEPLFGQLEVGIGEMEFSVYDGTAVSYRNQDPVGLGSRVKNTLREPASEASDDERKITERERELKKIRSKLGAPFEYEGELAEKTAEAAQLQRELVGSSTTVSPAAMEVLTAREEFMREAEQAGALTGESALFERAALRDDAMESGALPGEAATVLRRDANPNDTPIDRVTADGVLAAILEKFPGAPQSRIVDRFEDLPADVQNDAYAQGSNETDTKGAFDGQGNLWIVRENHSSIADLERTIFHEMLGHFGTRKFFGPAYVLRANQIYKELGGAEGLIKIAHARGFGKTLEAYMKGTESARAADPLKWNDETVRWVLTEEVFAHIAENQPTLMDRAKALIGWIRDKLRRYGFAHLAEMGETDLLHILGKARKGLEKPDGDGPRGGQTVLSRSTDGRDITANPNFVKWFGDSKVVDADGRPLVVYRGEHGETDLQFHTQIGSLSFGDRETANTYAMDPNDNRMQPVAPRVYPAYLKIERPFVGNDYGDPFLELREVERQLGRKEAERIASKFAVDIKNTGLWMEDIDPDENTTVEDFVKANPGRLGELYFSFYKFLDDAGEVAKLKAAGFDGAIHDGSGENAGETEYRVFDERNVKSAIGNNGDFNPSSPVIVFRTAAANEQADRGIRSQVRERIADFLDTRKTFNWWHKSVGTQYHKAQIDSDFRKVFDLSQQFLDDTARFANESADMAPELLPKMETVMDSIAGVTKLKRDSADAKAIAAPIFEGTLADQVWNDDTLRTRFNLDDRQIGLYREFRQAVDHSLDTLAISEMARVARISGLEIAPAGLTLEQSAEFYQQQFGADLERAEAAYEDLRTRQRAEIALLEDAANDEASSADQRERYAELRIEMRDRHAQERLEAKQILKGFEQLIAGTTDKAEKIRNLKANGYAPLMRFGKFTVDVYETGEDGNIFVDGSGTEIRHFFGMFESESEAKEVAKALQEEYPNARVDRGVLSEKSFQLFRGVTPETAEAYARMMGAEQSEAFQQYLKLAVNNRSAMKRLIQRKGIAGFNQDPVRVLATFLTSNARSAASNYHYGDMLRAASEIPKAKGDVKDEAVNLLDYIQNPREEAGKLRGLLFFNFLGGSVASALVNMTQPITMTYPYLHQFGGNTVSIMTQAMSMAGKRMFGKDVQIDDQALAAALTRATDEGIVSPHEIHMLYGESMRAGMFQGNRVWRAAIKVWGSFFSLAEHFNRDATFIAAYQIAEGMSPEQLRSQGVADAYDFAKKAVYDTQGIYCVDTDTEILTADDGWKHYDQLSQGQRVFSIDEHGLVVEDAISNVHVFNGRHEVTEFRNRHGLSIVVTDDHRNIIQNYNSRDKKWQRVRAVQTRDLKDCHFFLRVPLGNGIERDAIYSDDQVRLLAWVAAEGHFFAHRNCKVKRAVGLVQSATHNPEYVAEIDALLDRLGAHYNRKSANRKCGDTMICWQLRKPLWSFVGEALPEKRVTMDLLDRLTVPQMRIFLETFAKGDGTFLDEGGYAIGQKSVETLNTLQAMAVLTGNSSTMWGRHKDLKNGCLRDYGTVYVAKNSKRASVKEFERTRLTVDTVWCPETTTGTWIARRNGRTFITGNSKSNRPNWARGAVGATLFTFKQFSIAYLEFLKRLPNKERAIALAILVVAAGVQGLPGSDDLDDLIDTLAESFGYAWNTKQEKKAFVAGILGNEIAEFMMHGVSPFIPLDIAGRMSVGNLAPGSAIFKRSTADKSREVLDFAGPAGGLAKQALTAFENLQAGDMTDFSQWGRAAGAFAPKAMRDVMQAIDMGQTGIYRDTRGRRVVDVTPVDALIKGIGFQPSQVAESSRGRQILIQNVNLAKAVQGDIHERIARGMFDRDRDKVLSAREDLATWNRRNPQAPLMVNMANVQRRVREMAKSADERFIKSAPKLMRQSIAEELNRE